MTRALSAILVLLVLLASPVAALSAVPIEGPVARVSLEEAGGVWNGVSRLGVAPGEEQALLWVPASARVHAVVAELPDGTEAPAGWRAAGPEAIAVSVPPNASRVHASFDFPARGAPLASYRAPAYVGTLSLEVRAPEGMVASSDDAGFVLTDRGVFAATLQRLQEGARVEVRVVEADRVGEVPVALAVAGLSLVVLGLGVLWHRARPPLGGRDPERFLDHLSELQARVLPPAVAFGALNVLYFVTGLRQAIAAGVPLVAPTFGVERSLATRAFDAMAERLVPEGVTLVVLRPVDAVLVQVQMTLFLAFLTVLPLLLYEAGRFVAPALLTPERRALARTLPLVLVLFVAGAAAGFLVMAPLMIGTLYGYAPNLGATALLSVGDLASFALVIAVAFGVAAELPVAMYALSRLGLVRAATFRRYFRHAVVAIFLLAGIVTPDPSVVSQALVGLPVTALYAAGMLTASAGESRRDAGARARGAGAA